MLLAVPLGLHKTLLRRGLAFATSFLAIAILVNSLLTFCNASAVLFPVSMFQLLSGETIGFVMYWCWKNTLSLIHVTLVLVMYTQKHQ
jgi:hypothetical protein